MKNLLVFVVIVIAGAMGMVRCDIGAQEPPSADRAGSDRAVTAAITELAPQLVQSSDALAARLGRALQTPVGQTVLRDFLGQRAVQKIESEGRDVVEIVLADYFDSDGSVARLKPGNDRLRTELLRIGPASKKHLEQLQRACRAIAEQIDGDDEATLLVKRFLSEDYGPTFLYVERLHQQMQPGLAMLADSIGRIVVADRQGRLHIKPDVADDVESLVDSAAAIRRSAQRLGEELAQWGTEIAPIDTLHQRLREATQDRMFAAMIVAEQVFEKKRAEGVSVYHVMAQLESMVVDTPEGLQLGPGSVREEVARVLDQFDQVRERIEIVRPALADFRQALALDDPLAFGFAELLETDVALAAVAKATENAGSSVDQLVRETIGAAFRQQDGRLKLVEDRSVRQEVIASIQEALRETRALRRRSAPVRELAQRLADRELAEALDTVGGIMVVRRLVEQKLADMQAELFEEWKSRVLQSVNGELVVRPTAREEIESLLERIEEWRAGEE